MLTKFKQQLKAKAHPLKPIVLIGNNGCSDNVITEIDRGLIDHELIKIRLPQAEKAEKKAMLDQITAKTKAELVQLIGRIAVLYRKNTEEK